RNRSVDRRDELALPLPLLRRRTKIPFDWLRRNAQCRQKLEVLVLDVLNRVGRNFAIRKKPVHVARTGAIETELQRGPRQRRYDSRLEVHLEIDHQIETPPRELTAHEIGR